MRAMARVKAKVAGRTVALDRDANAELQPGRKAANGFLPISGCRRRCVWNVEKRWEGG